MNKAALVQAVATQLDVSKSAAQRSVDSVLGCIQSGVRRDRAVQIAGFGTFRVRQREARQGRNPRTGETIRIRASKAVAFKAGKKFKSYV
jgi:DNA-binding protein HU-beta